MYFGNPVATIERLHNKIRHRMPHEESSDDDEVNVEPMDVGPDLYPDFESFKQAMDKFYRDKWYDEKIEVARIKV